MMDLTLFAAYWPWLLLAALWTLPWKGIALWTAARKGHKLWFVILLVVNTLGVLEIAYVFYFSRHYGTEKKFDNGADRS